MNGFQAVVLSHIQNTCSQRLLSELFEGGNSSSQGPRASQEKVYFFFAKAQNRNDLAKRLSLLQNWWYFMFGVASLEFSCRFSFPIDDSVCWCCMLQALNSHRGQSKLFTDAFFLVGFWCLVAFTSTIGRWSYWILFYTVTLNFVVFIWMSASVWDEPSKAFIDCTYVFFPSRHHVSDRRTAISCYLDVSCFEHREIPRFHCKPRRFASSSTIGGRSSGFAAQHNWIIVASDSTVYGKLHLEQYT